jgi:simple sugar transport system permease protein
LLWPAAVGAGLAAGALWGLIPGWLKARWGAHEVINTIMLNFLAAALSNYLLSRHLALPESVRMPEVATSLQLPRLATFLPALAGSPVNLSLAAAVIAAVLGHVLLHRTRPGFAIRCAGAGPRAARWAGLRVPRILVWTMAGSGALAALVGWNGVLGYKHYYEGGMTGGVGYLGIAVALMARNEPLAVLASALFFGFLSYAGLVLHDLVPKEAVDVLTGAVLLFVVTVESWRMRRPRRWTPREAG